MANTNQAIIDSMAFRIKELEKELASANKALVHQSNINNVFNEYTRNLVLTVEVDPEVGTDIYSDFDIYINEELELVKNSPQHEVVVDAALSLFRYNMEGLEGEHISDNVLGLLGKFLAKYESIKESFKTGDAGSDGQQIAGALISPAEDVITLGDANIINTALIAAIKQANSEADKYYNEWDKQADRADIQLRFIGSNLSLQDTAVIDHLAASLRSEFDTIRKSELNNYEKISALRGLCWVLGDSVSDAAETAYLEQEMMQIYASTTDIDKNFNDLVRAHFNKKSKSGHGQAR